MPEIHDNSEGFKAYEPPLEVDPNSKRTLSRRELLKIAGLAAGSVVAGLGIGKTIKHSLEAEAEEAKKHEKHIETEIIGKAINPGRVINMPTGGFPAGGMVSEQMPEKYVLKFTIVRQGSDLEVTKELYDSVKQGDKVKVKYDDRSMQVLAIEK